MGTIRRVKYDHKNRTDINEPGLLWKDIIELSQVDRFYKNIIPKEKSTFLGRADVTFVVETKSGVLFPFKVRGLVVKVLKGKPYVGMPADKSETDGEYYDRYMPKSRALNTVLTTFVFSDEEIQAALDEAGKKAEHEGEGATHEGEGFTHEGEEQPALTSDNPFADAAATE